VVLSCIAVIGAIPVGNRAPAEAIVRRQSGHGDEGFITYVPCYLQLPHVERWRF
jgi:hypothetical protein